jgi:hypothetical protein
MPGYCPYLCVIRVGRPEFVSLKENARAREPGPAFIKSLPIQISNQAKPPTERLKALVSIVVPQRQAMFRPRCKHAIGLVDAMGNEIIDQYADIRVLPSHAKERPALCCQRRIDTGH